MADRVILEVNAWQPAELEGMHDIYYGTALPPHRKPIPILAPGRPHRRALPALPAGEDRRRRRDGRARTRNAASSRPTPTSQPIAGHVLDFLSHEVKRAGCPPTLLPLQSGVGNVANAVLAGLAAGRSGRSPPTPR